MKNKYAMGWFEEPSNMHINLNETGTRALDVVVNQENGYYVAKKITLSELGVKTPVKMKTPKRAKMYEMLFRTLYNEYVDE